MTDSSGQCQPYLIALADQMHAAVRDRDGERFAHAVQTLYLRDPATARVILRESLQRPLPGPVAEDP